MSTGGVPADLRDHLRHRRVDGHDATFPRTPVLHPDGAVGQPAADDDDRRDPDELGVLELRRG